MLFFGYWMTLSPICASLVIIKTTPSYKYLIEKNFEFSNSSETEEFTLSTLSKRPINMKMSGLTLSQSFIISSKKIVKIFEGDTRFVANLPNKSLKYVNIQEI